MVREPWDRLWQVGILMAVNIVVILLVQQFF